MTSATQIAGSAIGTAPGFGATAVYGRSPAGLGERNDEPDASRLPGQDRTEEAQALQGRRPAPPQGTAPTTSDVVRLPGQEAQTGTGPRNPLIAGGAFTLAVAIGLSLDQQTLPDSLQRATPSSIGEVASEDDTEATEELGLDGLTEGERELVKELQKGDAEIRRHESAHAAVGGDLAGPATFTYQTGPDGKRYAIGGKVSIDTAPVKGDPEATIRKAQRIQAAASAPAEPSSQDRRVAAQANALRQQAQAELAAERREGLQGGEAGASESGTSEAGQPGNPQPDAAIAAQGVDQPLPAAPPAIAPTDDAGPASTAQGSGQRTVGAGTAEANAGGFARFSPVDYGPASSPVPANDEPDQGSVAEGPFRPGAFNLAAASYRGSSAGQSLVSIAV